MKANKVALITGGNRGIGFETAKQLGNQGIYVVIGARNHKDAIVSLDKLKSLGIESDAIVLDINNRSHHTLAANYFKENFGKLDILVNNAGIMLEGEPMEVAMNPSPALKVNESHLRETMETNFFSVLSLTKELAPLILKSDEGRIVNVSSFLGSLTLQSDPNFPGYPVKSFAYNTSKLALNSLTVHLAYELRETSIKVNSANPGWVQTDMGGKSAPMTIEEGAKTSVQLTTLPKDGPTGGFFHLGDKLPW